MSTLPRPTTGVSAKCPSWVSIFHLVRGGGGERDFLPTGSPPKCAEQPGLSWGQALPWGPARSPRHHVGPWSLLHPAPSPSAESALAGSWGQALNPGPLPAPPPQAHAGPSLILSPSHRKDQGPGQQLRGCPPAPGGGQGRPIRMLVVRGSRPTAAHSASHSLTGMAWACGVHRGGLACMCARSQRPSHWALPQCWPHLGLAL